MSGLSAYESLLLRILEYYVKIFVRTVFEALEQNNGKDKERG